MDEWFDPLPKVNRFEVIDGTGRVYSGHGVMVELSYQDDGRTLKVFVKPRKLNNGKQTGTES